MVRREDCACAYCAEFSLRRDFWKPRAQETDGRMTPTRHPAHLQFPQALIPAEKFSPSFWHIALSKLSDLSSPMSLLQFQAVWCM